MGNYEIVWKEFWQEIVCDEQGIVDLEQVKKELCDMKTMLNNVPAVYCHITGNSLSKPFYEPNVIISEADNHYWEFWEDIYQTDIGNILNTDMPDSDKLEEIKEYIYN